MHEVGLMQSALETVARIAHEHNFARVLRIGLRVGLLSGVVPEALEFAFEVLRQGTVAAEAELEIEIVPAQFWCEKCQTEYNLDQFEFECAHCGGPLVLRGGGTELELAIVEGEKTGTQNNPADVEQTGNGDGSVSGRP